MVEYMNIYLGMNFFIPFLDNHILKCIRFCCIFEFFNFNATFNLLWHQLSLFLRNEPFCIRVNWSYPSQPRSREFLRGGAIQRGDCMTKPGRWLKSLDRTSETVFRAFWKTRVFLKLLTFKSFFQETTLFYNFERKGKKVLNLYYSPRLHHHDHTIVCQAKAYLGAETD